MSTVMSPIKEDDQLLVQDDQSKALYVSTHPNSVRAKASAAASARAPSNLALFHFNGASFTRSPRGLLHTILAPSPHTSYCISTLFYFLYFLLVCLVIFLCFFAGLDPLSSTWPRFSPFGSVYACCRERLVVQLVSVWSQTVSPRCGTAGCATKTFLVTRRTRGTTRTRKSTGEILQHVLYLVHFTRFYMALRTQLICTRGLALRRRVQTSDRGSHTAVEKMDTLISWRPSSFSSRKSSRPTCLISASSSRSTHGMAAVFVSVTVGVCPPTPPNSIVHWGGSTLAGRTHISVIAMNSPAKGMGELPRRAPRPQPSCRRCRHANQSGGAFLDPSRVL